MSARYKVVVHHGKHVTLFQVVDTQAPESEQPCVVVVCGSRKGANRVARFHNTWDDEELSEPEPNEEDPR